MLSLKSLSPCVFYAFIVKEPYQMDAYSAKEKACGFQAFHVTVANITG